ncbi:hypothetical protein AB0H43_04680 [Hamadaea sp. NPDC050747]|uniref:hypothetical protein n=1 Tax=Hamadaea sp. NPDC050747 TaxID=3155789 RepID=UPI0033C78733
MQLKRWVVATMYAGLGLTVLASVVPFAARNLLAEHIQAGYPAYDRGQVDSAVGLALTLLTVVGVLGVLAWIGTTWAVQRDKRWARPVATVMFLVGASLGLTGLLTRDTSGDTGLPATLGLLGLVPSLAGLLAVALLWIGRRPGVR